MWLVFYGCSLGRGDRFGAGVNRLGFSGGRVLPAAAAARGDLTIVGLLELDRWDVTQGAVQPCVWLNQWTQVSVRSSRSSTVRTGPS